MPKASGIQSSFAAGEISPLLQGRVDLSRYKEGLAICQNYIPLLQGPKTRRPGTGFVFPVKNSAAVTRLIPFSVSTTQNFMLEFGNQYVRFHENYAPVTNTPVAISAVTQASNAVVTAGASATSLNLSNVTQANPAVFTVPSTSTLTRHDGAAVKVLITGVVGMTQLNGNVYTVAILGGGTTFEVIGLDSTGFGAYVSGGQVTILPNNGDHIIIEGVSGMTELNNKEYVVAGISNSTFNITDNITGLTVNSAGFVAYTSGGTFAQIYEINNAIDGVPYLTADIPQIKFAQSDDVLYLVHPKYPPATLTRVLNNQWQYALLSPLDGPYNDEDEQGTTFTLNYRSSGTQPHWYITASSMAGINGDLGFQPTDVGRVVRVEYASNWYWWSIESVTDTLNVYIQDNSGSTLDPSGINVPSGTVVAGWRLGLWNGADGYPTAVVFYQDRLVFGGAGGDPTRFDGSNSGDYENFAPTAADGTVAANNAYAFPLAAADLNSIMWMNSDEQGLLIGTANAEWIVNSADSTSALSPLSVSAKKTTSMGSNPVQAVQLGKCSLFVQQGGRKLREMQYNFYATGYVSNDLTQLSEHISTGGILFLASQKTPQPIMWGVRGDGTLIAMTYERDLESVKVGWSRHVIGGSTASGIAVVESVAVLPSADGTTQNAWIIVQRLVNGNTVRYIEYITNFFDDTTSVVNAIFFDASLTYNGSPTTTISGLNHLNGQTLGVLADGNVQTNKVPINGRITLDTAASVVTVGLAYNSDGQKLRTDSGAADGTAMGKTRRTNRMGIQFLNTGGFTLGPDFNTLDSISLDNTTAGIIGNNPGLFTGVCTEILSTDYDFDNMVCWRQNTGLPGTILGFYPQQETQDR